MLQSVIGEMRAAGTTDVVLEATSHALDQGRLEGCRFRVAGLTNLTQDHLDFHGTMERYFDAKAILFERLMRDTGAASASSSPTRTRGAACARGCAARAL